MPHGVLAEPTDLVTHAPSGAQMRFVIGILVFMALVFALLAPFARTPMPQAPAFIPMYQSVLIAANLLTGILLLGHVQTARSWPLGILTLGYFFTALIATAHMLTFPGLFNAHGILGGNSQTPPWLFMCWHALYPLFVLGYTRTWARGLPPHFMRVGVLLTVLFVAILVLISTGGADHLPQLRQGLASLPLYHGLASAILLLSVVVLWRMVRKPQRSVLDVWLIVAMAAWVFEVALSSVLNGARFDLGFYTGRLFGLGASVCVLGALANDNIALHARLQATFQEMVETRARVQWQSLLGTVLRQLPDGVVIVDYDGNCVTANEQANRMAERFTHAGAPGQGGNAAMLGLIAAPVARAIAGEPFRDAVLESAHAGTRRVYSVSGAPLRDGARTLAAAVVVLDDVTERSEASAALARALDQTRYLIENTPLAVIEWNRDLEVTLWNRRAEELFGWRSADVVGRRIDTLALVPAEEAGQAAAMIARLLDANTRYTMTSNHNTTRDGRTLCCEWYNSVLVDEGGDVLTVMSLVLDVTEREAAMEGLREADRRKDVYIATLAHELRNPLAPIANAASLLRSKGLPQERIEWIAAMVGRQATQMARLLDDLLDVTRIGRGKIELRRARLDLGRLIRDTLQTSMPLIEAGRHRVSLALAPEPLWVDGDALRLTQVLANLINNAAKYTPPGGEIEIGLRDDAGQALVWVRDNGIGLEADVLTQVFDPFVQVGSASHLAQGGLGIGLSLARGLVELHGGTIRADSPGPGRGATFSVRLPLGEAAAAPEDDTGPHGGGAALAGRRILIADDNVDAAESLCWLLRSEGATVSVAHDGAQALRLFNERPAMIVVLDLGMPEMDGLEVAAILTRKTPRPWMVAVTGRGRQEDRAASLAAGFDEHLTKPVAPQQLIELLQQACATAQ